MYPEQRVRRTLDIDPDRISYNLRLSIRLGLRVHNGLGFVDDVVFVCFNLLAVFPFFLLAECNGNRKEAAILSQQEEIRVSSRNSLQSSSI